MPNLFEMFKYAKLFNVTDGELSLMDVPINIIPTNILCSLQKGLINAIGLEKAYKQIYASAKDGSKTYNERFVKTQKFTDPHKILDWQVKIVTFAGWGKLEIAKVDIKNDSYVVQFRSSAFPKTYGKANYAVDFVPTGFVAGGLSANMKKELDALETKCMARGDPFCEIEVGLAEVIENKRVKLWKEWKLI